MICFVFLGLTYRIPPPPEEGITINFGYNDFGSGAEQPEQIIEEEEITPQEVVENNPVVDEISTQEVEETPVVKEKIKEKKKPEKESVKIVSAECKKDCHIHGNLKVRGRVFEGTVIKKFYKSHYDEQKMLSEKTKLYCEKNRIDGLNKAILDNKDVAIFDDGLQDRSINYDLKIVCFNDLKLIGNGFLIPAGPLREKINSISKYDMAFINGNEVDNSKLKLLLKSYNANIEIFETNYKAINIKEFNINDEYMVFSGIGNPESFRQTLINNNIKITKEIIFPDHYNYTHKDIDQIKYQAKKFNLKILTTEKDYIKIKSIDNNDIRYLKVELDIKNEDRLINHLKKYI